MSNPKEPSKVLLRKNSNTFALRELKKRDGIMCIVFTNPSLVTYAINIIYRLVLLFGELETYTQKNIFNRYNQGTYRLIEDCDEHAKEIACWSKAGDALIIKDSKVLETSFIPKYFENHPQFQSFVRQLNNYGFRKDDRRYQCTQAKQQYQQQMAIAEEQEGNQEETYNKQYLVFRHEYFLRGRKEFLTKIKLKARSSSDLHNKTTVPSNHDRKCDEVQPPTTTGPITSDTAASLQYRVQTIEKELFSFRSKMDAELSSLCKMKLSLEEDIKSLCALKNNLQGELEVMRDEMRVFVREEFEELLAQRHSWVQVTEDSHPTNHRNPGDITSLCPEEIQRGQEEKSFQKQTYDSSRTIITASTDNIEDDDFQILIGKLCDVSVEGEGEREESTVSNSTMVMQHHNQQEGSAFTSTTPGRDHFDLSTTAATFQEERERLSSSNFKSQDKAHVFYHQQAASSLHSFPSSPNSMADEMRGKEKNTVHLANSASCNDHNTMCSPLPVGMNNVSAAAATATCVFDEVASLEGGESNNLKDQSGENTDGLYEELMDQCEMEPSEESVEWLKTLMDMERRADKRSHESPPPPKTGGECSTAISVYPISTNNKELCPQGGLMKQKLSKERGVSNVSPLRYVRPRRGTWKKCKNLGKVQ